MQNLKGLKMNKLQKYPKYKNSGVEWIGEIPEHWNVRRLKYVANLFYGYPFNSEYFTKNNGIKVVRIGDINDPIDFTKCINSFEEILDKKAKIIKNDTLIALSGATTGKCCFIRNEVKNAYINQRIVRINYINSFIYYITSNDNFTKYLLIGADGSAQENLSNYSLKNSYIPMPPKEEQIQIAEYLDKKTEKIDKLISIKEKLIKKLKEQRQIIINNAVTKGLNPNVKMKDSGIEWIGEIPEHWEIVKGKRLFKQEKRSVKPNDEIITCFRDGMVTLRKNRRIEGFTNALKEHGYQGIRKGDLVIHAMDAFAGAIGISDSDGKSSPVYSVCVPWNKNTTLPLYYAKYLRNLALQGFIKSLAKGIRERSTDFRFKDFGELLLPFPSYQEQIQIAKYLDKKTAQIDKAIKLQEEQIKKLKEYKTTLIDSVVTGKVRVIK